jgi:hypothetical protein
VGRQDARVDHRDGHPGAGARGPGLRHVEVGVDRAEESLDLLTGVLQPPEAAHVLVAGERVHGVVGRGVDDVGIGLERAQRLVGAAGGHGDELGARQRERLDEPDAGVRAHVGALGGVEPGRALHDDRLREGRLGQDEAEGEQNKDERSHAPRMDRPAPPPP